MIQNTLHFGNYQAEKNSIPIKYRIQNATPDLTDEIVAHLLKFYVPREPLCALVDLINDPESVESIIQLWHHALSDGTGIVALLDDNRGARGKVIGINLTCISTNEKDKPKLEFKGKCFNLVLDAVNLITERGNIFEKYGVDKYLTAYGLSVSSDYHGYNIGYRILAAREPLCKSIGLDLTGTVFSAGTSQYLAKKLGYETLYECDYADFDLYGTYPLSKMLAKVNEKKINIMARHFSSF